MSKEPSWDVYRSFAAVLQHGSLSAASRVLGMTQPSIARHIDALEQAIGAKLFVRSQRGLSATDHAWALRPHAEALVAAAEALRRSAGGAPGMPEGTVRITASQAVGTHHLPAILTSLRHAQPRLHFELALTDDLDDLLQRQSDIAIRMAQPEQKSLVAKSVGSVRLGFHAHRNYLERRGAPDRLEDLREHDLIGFDTETPFTRAGMRHLPQIERWMFALRVDDAAAQFEAIRAGFGIGICQTAVARRDTDICRVLADAFDLPLPVWIVMHEDLRNGSRYRFTFDGLVRAFARITQATRGA
jgi:DNA-binding transcriptional LysR family regulator